MITFNITVHRPTVTVAGSGTLSSDITALTGSSGSGKSTIIKSLAGLVKPDEGFIKRDDMVWYSTSGSGFIWYLDGTPAPGSYLITAGTLPSMASSYRMYGAGDFNRDGYPDFVLRNPTNGAGEIWLMNQNVFGQAVQLPTVAPAWQIGTVGDFNGDSMPDIAWRNTSTGENALWLMNGTTYVVSVPLPTVTDQGWRMVR